MFDPQIGLPIISFVLALAAYVYDQRKASVALAIYSVGVFAALFYKNLPTLFLVLVYFEALLAIQTKNFKSLLGSVMSLLPIAVGLTLSLTGPALAICTIITCFMRVSQWPLRIGSRNPDNLFERGFYLILSVSAFALWRTQVDFHGPEAGVVFLVCAVCAAIGGNFGDMSVILGLGLFSVSPVAALISIFVWPLIGMPGRASYAIVLPAVLSAMLLVGTLDSFLPSEATLAVGIVLGIVFARAFVIYKSENKTRIHEGILVLILLAQAGAIGSFLKDQILEMKFSDGAFGLMASFIAVYSAGLWLSKKKPGLFKKIPSVDVLETIRDRINKIKNEKLFLGKEYKHPHYQFHDRFLVASYSEALLAVLFGVLGALLFWSQQ